MERIIQNLNPAPFFVIAFILYLSVGNVYASTEFYSQTHEDVTPSSNAFAEPVYTDSSSRTITDHDHLHITEVPYTIVIENTNTEPILKLTNTSRGVMVPPTVLLEKDHSKTYTDNGNDTTDNSTTKSTIPKCETSEGLCDSLSHDAHVNEPKIKTTYVPDNSRSVTPNKIQLTTPECEFSKEKDCELLRHVINNAKTNAVPVLTKSTLRNVVVSAIMTTQQTKVTETTLVNKPSKLPMKRTTMDFEKLLVDVINKSNLSVPQSTQSEIERIELLTEISTHNSANANVTIVNSILEKLKSVVNGSSEFKSSTASSLLLNISQWNTADKSTIEECSRMLSTIVTKVTENTTTATDREESMIVMQNTLLTVENILISSISTDTTVSTSAIDIVAHTLKNVTSDIHMETAGGTVIISQKLFINRIVRVSTVVFHNEISMNLANNGPLESARVSSNVIGVSLQEMNATKPHNIPVIQKGAIIVTLPTDITRREKRRICCYWNFSRNGWSSDGGAVLDKNETHTTCIFDHLTNFAVLVLYYDDLESQLTISQENVLMIMTTVGCSISITCLGMTIFAFLYFKMMWKETILVHGNLSVALLLGQLVLVASDEALRDMLACKAVAMVMHYFFLASFTWMLMEGIALYMSCTRGFHYHGNMRWRYLLVGWGIPLIIVIISIGAEFQNYGNGGRVICWLSTNDGLIWAFMGPMLVIIMFNIFILGMAVRVFLTLETNARQSDAAKIRASIRAVVFLLPLLGITWLLSILVPLHVAFHYLFVLGNSLQGMMIFFLHCVCNKEIRKKILERKKQLSISQKTYGESEVARKRPRTVDAFCDVQVELPSTDRKYAWVS